MAPGTIRLDLLVVALQALFPFRQNHPMLFFIGVTHLARHIRRQMPLMGERDPVDLSLVIFESLVAQIAFRADDMSLMGQVDGALGMALDAGGLGAFMTGKAAFHARPVRLGGHFIVHDVIMTDGALAARLLHVQLVGDDDFHHVMFEGLDVLLGHVGMAPQAVGVRPFGFRLVIAGNPLRMDGMALRTIDLGVDQRFFQERYLILPVMASQAILRPGSGEMSQPQKGDGPQDHADQRGDAQDPGRQMNHLIKNLYDRGNRSADHAPSIVLSSLKLWRP